MADVTTSTAAAEITPIHPPTCCDYIRFTCVFTCAMCKFCTQIACAMCKFGTQIACAMCLPLFICLAVLMILVAFVPPEADSPDFRVHSAALQYPHINATRSSSDLTATLDVTLIATNPNMKWDIYCDRLQPALFTGLFFNCNPTGLRVASTSLRPLFLKSSNQTSVSFKLPMLSANVPDDVAKEISDDNTTALLLKFGLMISVHCSYRAHLNKKKTPESISTHYFCNLIQVRVRSNDTNNNNNSHITEAGSFRVTTDHQATACQTPRWSSKNGM